MTRRLAALAGLSLLLAGCQDFFSEPVPTAGLEIVPIVRQTTGGGPAAAFGVVDAVRILIVDESQVPVVDTVVTARPGATELRVRIATPEDLAGPVLIAAELRRGTDALFQGVGTEILIPGRITSTEIDMVPVPVSLEILSPTVDLNEVGDTLSLVGVSLMATGDTIGQFPFAWTTDNALVAGVDQDGWVQARGIGSTIVVAFANLPGLPPVADTAVVTVQGPSTVPPASCAGPVTVATRADMRALAGQQCGDISGNLIVTSEEIQEVGSLFRLQQVAGDVVFQDNPALKSLSFNALGQVDGRVVIDGNDSLRIAQMDFLASAATGLNSGTALQVTNNEELYFLSVPNLSDIGGDRIDVSDNPNMQFLFFYNGPISFAGTLVARNNPLLCASDIDQWGGFMGLSQAEVTNTGNDNTCPPANRPPLAAAGGPYSGAVGSDITLDGSVSFDPDGTIVAYDWIVNPGGTQLSGVAPTYTCTQAGSFIVDLIVTDDGGLQGSAQTTLTCSAGPLELRGRWVNEGGQPITSVAIGSTAVLQLCAVFDETATFAANLNYEETIATLSGALDLNTAASLIHPDCQAVVDQMPTFTFTPGTGTVLFQSSSPDPTGGNGPQGVGEFAFTAVAPGSFQPNLSGVSSTDAQGNPLVFLPDIDAIDVFQPAIAAMDLGTNHTCLVDSTLFQAFCWGFNAGGALGTGSTVDSNFPLNVVGISDVLAITAGSDDSCALLAGDVVECWGFNAAGAVGDGTTTTRLSPTPVVGAPTLTSVQMGGGFACGLSDADRIWCWGENGQNQLGDGTSVSRGTPAEVAGQIDFVEYSVGEVDACAIDTVGETWCWGANYGSVPAIAAGGFQFIKLSVGDGFVCATEADGTPYCWGRNNQGQLGNGTLVDSQSPIPVSGGLRFSTLSAGGDHACGSTAGGQAFCWGLNSFGQVGDGSATQQVTVPSQVLFGAAVLEVYTGALHSCLRDNQNQPFCWGYNLFGQVGNGTNANQDTPVPVFPWY